MNGYRLVLSSHPFVPGAVLYPASGMQCSIEHVPDTTIASGSLAVEPLILVAEDDRDLGRMLREYLAMDGLRCEVAHDGRTAFERAVALRPQLIVLDLGLPELSGDEVFARLRADHRTRYTPVVFLTAAASRDDKVRHLRAGADDYITKPVDLDELSARLQTALRRARTLGGLNPLSGLPGNAAIHAEISGRLRGNVPFACLYVDIDSFKSFNDRYGFTRGDTMITALADSIITAVETHADDAFIGHIGGDDFVVVTTVERAEALASSIIEHFDARSRELHDEGDRAAGGFEAADRRGTLRRWPLTAVSVGVATASPGAFSSPAALAQRAAEMKCVAKRRGRSVAVDRRHRA